MSADDPKGQALSEIRQFYAPAEEVERRVPWYVYVVAILLLGWGSLVLSVWISQREFGYPFWKDIVPTALEMVIGCGLLLRRRWGWVLGVATSVVFIAEGLHRIVFVPGGYAVLGALVRYLVPAIVILVSLLPGRARRAFLGERPAHHN